MPITERQEEFLLTAIEKGYFDSPQKVTLGQLAEELGVSAEDVRSELRAALQAASREFWGKIG